MLRKGITKGRVKAPKKRTPEPTEETLTSLSNAIIQIQLQNASKLSFEEHYRYAYNLVVHKNGHNLYNTLAQVIINHLHQQTKDKIIPVFPPNSTSTADNVASAAAGQLFLTCLKQVWLDHVTVMGKLRDILKYMVFCLHSLQLDSFTESFH